MSLSFNKARALFKELDFYLIAHPVVLHHLRKEFKDYDVLNDRFYIKQVGNDFLHVAIIEHQCGRDGIAVQIRYTCAGDDLLYGLHIKFNSGGAINNQENVNEITAITERGNLKYHGRYVRKRFRHGRTKAKIRAFIIMIKDLWAGLFK